MKRKKSLHDLRNNLINHQNLLIQSKYDLQNKILEITKNIKLRELARITESGERRWSAVRKGHEQFNIKNLITISDLLIIYPEKFKSADKWISAVSISI